MLTLAAGTIGFGFALAGVWLFTNAVTGITFPYYVQWTMDERVILFVAAACAGTVLCLAAARRSRIACGGLAFVGGCERTITAGVRRRRLTTVLLTVEVALTLVLLAGAGLLMRSFLAVYRADSVVDAASVLTMPLFLPNESYPTEERRAICERLQERLDAIPGVSWKVR